jgi:hypothetical protein
MLKFYFKKILPKTISQKIYIFLAIIILVLNITELKQYIAKIKPFIRLAPSLFDGRKFTNLKPFLKEEQYVSYITDKNLEHPKNSKQFAQAQYTLSPIILDEKNLNHKYAIVDCSTDKISQAVIKQLKAVPLKKNNFGIYLTQLQK